MITAFAPRLASPQRPEMPAPPALSAIGIYSLAELFHQDRAAALKLAAENAANWSKSK